ncbi:MAG TPA: HRDC domain-containing protein [Anaerolineales bacterium]|nr:HRDC domain-containing protein [Anaerolineales bacterium]
MVFDPLASPELVQSSIELRRLVGELSRQVRIAVDTESNSLHAYLERVCLIQFSTAEMDYLVDPLALDDLNLLGPIFADPKIEKVFHAAEYDLICLRRDYGFDFANLFDTMQASRILGRKQAGLDRLVEEKFNVKVNKRFQKADWGARPLSRDLMLYARLDTHFLLPLRDLLKAELEEKGLWPLAQEDFWMACHANGVKAKPESPYWSRFSNRRDLSLRDLTVLNELLAFREQTAARLDRPPFKVLDDDRLVEMAKTRPSSISELEVELTSKQIQNWGSQILEAIARGTKMALVKRQPPERPSSAYVKRLDKLKNWRKKVAAEMDVESDVVLPRSLLLALVEGGPEELEHVMKCSPWRLEHFGVQIAKVLGG